MGANVNKKLRVNLKFMSHSHNHLQTVSKNTNLGKLIWSICINVFIVIFELTYGLVIGSLALISDAFHNLTDIASMVLSYAGEKISARSVNDKKTYGYKKIEAIVAFVNSMILLAVIIFILVEAIKHLFHPSEINGLSMLIVAGVAFVGNSVATAILQTKGKNLNMKSAWLHSLQDALFSLAVIVAAILIYYFHWNIIDPIISIVISLFLIKETYSITKESINILMDSVPRDIDFTKVRRGLLQVKNVAEVKDLHIWQANSQTTLLSAHIIVKDDASEVEVLRNAIKMLSDKFAISHSTLQIISVTDAQSLTACEHCN